MQLSYDVLVMPGVADKTVRQAPTVPELSKVYID